MRGRTQTASIALQAAFGCALAAGVILAAEYLGPRQKVYAGALAGMLLGLLGWVSAVWLAVRFRAGAAPSSGRYDVWGIWVSGFLARLVCLGLLCWALQHYLGEAPEPALYTLAAVYLTLHFWETAWLYRRLEPAGNSFRHG